MSKFNIGDKVRVRKDLIVNKGYGYQNFVEDMMPFLGEIVTIQAINYGDYAIEEDNGDWNWTDEMFEEEPIKTCVIEVDNVGHCDCCKNKEENMYAKKILDIYFNRKRNKILEEDNKKIEEIKAKDNIQKILQDTENEINVMLNRNETNRFSFGYYSVYGIYETETEEKLRENDIETSKKLCDLKNLRNEIEAQLNAIPKYDSMLYDYTINILKTYEVLNKEGKINA